MKRAKVVTLIQDHLSEWCTQEGIVKPGCRIRLINAPIAETDQISEEDWEEWMRLAEQDWAPSKAIKDFKESGNKGFPGAHFRFAGFMLINSMLERLKIPAQVRSDGGKPKNYRIYKQMPLTD